MGLTTRLCRQLGIQVPIVQGPIGSASSPELAAAVATAGGLGMLAVTWLEPVEVARRIGRIRALTDQPFGVNLSLAFPIDAQLEVCLGLGVRIVSTFWGAPASLHDVIASAGALHLHTVASAEEARAARDAGVDVIVAQGWEAGGHVWGEMATLPLIPAVVDAVAPLPVIAAGGISDGRGLAAVLALGAEAAWLGTRFLTATEAFTHDDYRARLIAATGTDTVRTTCFCDGWPDAPHRVLRNSTLSAWVDAGSPAAPGRPNEGNVLATDSRGNQWRRYDDMMPLADLHGQTEAMALYAGQSVGLVRDAAPAATIIATITAQAEERLAVLARGVTATVDRRHAAD